MNIGDIEFSEILFTINQSRCDILEHHSLHIELVVLSIISYNTDSSFSHDHNVFLHTIVNDILAVFIRFHLLLYTLGLSETMFIYK